MDAIRKITPALLRQLIDYDCDTGIFTWKRRSPEFFQSEGVARSPESTAKLWNGRLAGEIVGSVTKNGYRVTTIRGGSIALHTVAWMMTYGVRPVGIDHINRNRADNRIYNLREATQSENCRNLPIPKNNTSGTCGVQFDKRSFKWVAIISLNRRKHFLGSYKNIEDAILARRNAEKSLGFHENHRSVIS